MEPPVDKDTIHKFVSEYSFFLRANTLQQLLLKSTEIFRHILLPSLIFKLNEFVGFFFFPFWGVPLAVTACLCSLFISTSLTLLHSRGSARIEAGKGIPHEQRY